MSMKTYLYLIVSMCFVIGSVEAQTNGGSHPDVNELMKMTPAELEAYKKKMLTDQTEKAAHLIEKNNLNIDVRTVPGYDIKPPVKNVAKLALIPSKPPTRQELVSSVQQSISQVKQGMPAPKIQQIEQFSASQSIATIHDAAIMRFYNGDPAEGMLLLMQAVAKSPDSLQMVNNLGAMMNMIGAEHRAIPLLQYCLERVPQSSTVLNNLGQSFMALGDAMRAAEYLNRCLELDSLNIEANHSMGMLHMFKKEYAAGMKYFEREMSVAIRRSTLAMAYKTGVNFNLREITGRKHARNGAPTKNHFEEITMGKFSMPDFPASALEAKMRLPEFKAYAASVQAEAMHWQTVMNRVSMTPINPNEKPGIYSDLVEAMLEELHKEFNPEYLTNYSDDDAQWVQDRIAKGMTDIAQVKCAPLPGGTSLEAQMANDLKCCEERKRPLADQTIQEIGSHIQKITTAGQQRWKSYINQLVAIVQLDPGASNQAAVYGAVSGYFSYLSWGALFYTTGDINNLLAGCIDDYDQEEIDDIIQSDREWQMTCAAWLNLSVDLGGISVKADCSKYAVEAGKGWTFGYEHEFTTGNSTFLAGPGAKLEFLGLAKAETKVQAFITFDKNKEFADFGVKNTMKVGASTNPVRFGGVKLGTNLGAIEITNAISINSGYKSSVKTSGIAKILENL